MALLLFMQVVEDLVLTLIQTAIHFLHLLQKMAVAVDLVV
tara:strand:+ start:545 stop:664 length:120 start_codon:yes stop_codon:yes gene_type:complete